jgi:hypothetical protein
MVFILFRYITTDTPFDFYAGDKKIIWNDIHYHSEKKEVTDLMATDAVKVIKEKFPDFTPAAFLNGTAKPDHFKWLLTERVGNKNKIFGYAGNKFLELVMTIYHYFNDKYLSYASPKILSTGRLTLLSTWLLDKGIKKAFKNYLKYLAGNPFRMFKKVYMQSIMIIQPVDLMPNGDQSMCDGCPDITYWKDKDGSEKLVWSCRLEELINYDNFLRMIPKKGKTNKKNENNIFMNMDKM